MRETLCELFHSLLVAAGLLARASRAAQPAGGHTKKMDGALHVSQPGDELGLRVLGQPRLQRLLHRRYRVPARYRARGGVRIFDISDPASPQLVRDFACDANQNDPIVWDRNGNGVADLLLLAVDRTMANPNCGAHGPLMTTATAGRASASSR